MSVGYCTPGVKCVSEAEAESHGGCLLSALPRGGRLPGLHRHALKKVSDTCSLRLLFNILGCNLVLYRQDWTRWL